MYYLFLAFFLGGCAQPVVTNFEGVVKKRAAFDFNCNENYITVVPEGITRYAAQGCGQTGIFEVKCSLGPCMAKKIK